VTASARGILRFAERIVQLLDEGGFVATYKYAVLLALMDLCLERSAVDGSPPTSITTPQLAAKIVELYWPHARPFPETRTVLRQNSGGQARVVSLIEKFRDSHAPDPSASLHRARLHAPDAFRRLEREVEWKLVEMPLPKLQRLGDTVDPFLYVINWDDAVTAGHFKSPAFDNRILLQPEVPLFLVELAGVVRPLVHRHWVSMVTRLNDLQESRLEDFLFGRDRANLTPLCSPLLELQSGRCFYCDGKVAAQPQVDHFLPWARHPDDGLDNLVVAHARCNGDKSDFLADTRHVQRWAQHVATREADLSDIARVAHWDRDPSRTVSVVRAIYRNLPDDVRLWAIKREFVVIDHGAVARALAPVDSL
jgi:5-methylcytosine-specific restriction endonuclease McrA